MVWRWSVLDRGVIGGRQSVNIVRGGVVSMVLRRNAAVMYGVGSARR
jgi:hypothetical protein